MKNILIIILMMFTAILHAEDSHWTVNPHDYHYDMTVYALLYDTDRRVTNYDNKEVAAFVADECRAVGQVQAKNGYTWICFRVHSNAMSGEAVTFRVYNKRTQVETAEYVSDKPITFSADATVGLPSQPIAIRSSILVGDVNNDTVVDVADVNSIISVICGASTNTVADVNDDGVVDVADINAVISIICGK